MNTILVTIVLSVTFLILLVSLLAFAKYFRIPLADVLSLHQTIPRSTSNLYGIDKKTIESLPFFTFSLLKGSKEGLECAVCLSKFEDTEILRLLPICNHAFHMNCIDKWLERRSSCPLCRNKFDNKDLADFKLEQDPNPEVLIERELKEDPHQISSRFNLSAWKLGKGKNREDPLLFQEIGTLNSGKSPLHKFKHKIILSEIVGKGRWSDLESSDLTFLNSEMLNLVSSCRFSPSDPNEHVVKIDEVSHPNRLSEYSKDTKSAMSGSSPSASSSSSTCNCESAKETSRPLITQDEKRSLSEIVNIPRFMEFDVRNNNGGTLILGTNGSDERMRRLWLGIAKKTVHWFIGEDRSPQKS